MTAPTAREELEAVVHAQLTRAWKHGLRGPATATSGHAEAPADAILAAADLYAAAMAQEKIVGQIIGRARLEQATAERTGRPS